MDANTWTKRRLQCTAAALALFSLGRAQADVVEITRSEVSNSQVSLDWTPLETNAGYAVRSCGNLLQGEWRWAGDVDAWPQAGTNWTGTSAHPAVFYQVGATRRGRLVADTPIIAIPSNTAALALSTLGLTNLTATYNVMLYALGYETFDVRGLSTLATGALAVPQGAATAPLLSYQHGTIFLKDDAPSRPAPTILDMTGDQMLGVALASDGYVVAMPDYLGMGADPPALHPYLHARSEATACVDLLRAARSFLDDNVPALSLDGRLFVAGYSQGGHVTMALQHELETRHPVEWPLTASAPMAGPYDLSGTMVPYVLEPVPYDNPAYLPYLLFGCNGVYRYFESADELLESPYDVDLPPLMDGEHTSGQINIAMPSVPHEIFQAAYLDAFEADSNHTFRVILRANDTYRFAPATPTRLYHASGDGVVPYENSETALAYFTNHGAPDVALIDLGADLNHGSAAAKALLLVTQWFATF